MDSEVHSVTDVLIIGAGPTGLMLAAELARRGVNCRIVEQAAARRTAPKAINLHTRTLEILDDLGIAGDAIALGNRVYRLNSYSVTTWRRKRIWPIGQVDLTGLESKFPFTLTLPQPETERLIEEKCATYGVRVEWGTRFISLSQRGESVIAQLERGAQSEIVEAAWLVGCDGIDSTVRKALDLPFDGMKYPDNLLCADVSVRWDRPHDEAHVFLSRWGTLRFMPIPGPDRWRLVADVPAESADQLSPDAQLGRLQALVDARGARAALRELTWYSHFNIYRYFASKYRVGHVIVAGDAGHVHSPLGAQGMNLGLQDSYNLAWKLSLVVLGECRPKLLDSYEEERRPVAAKILHRTERNTRLIGTRGAIARTARNTGGRLLLQLPTVQRRVARSGAQLQVNYRKSRLVADGVGAPKRWLSGGPAPGDRAPDTEFGPAANRRRCHELLHGTRYVLLLFAGRADFRARLDLFNIAQKVQLNHKGGVQAFLITTEPPPAPINDDVVPLLPDPGGELHRCWGADAGTLYLVRPDGYVGYRAVQAIDTGISRYLDAVFVPADRHFSGESVKRNRKARGLITADKDARMGLWKIQILMEGGWPWLPVEWCDLQAELRGGEQRNVGTDRP